MKNTTPYTKRVESCCADIVNSYTGYTRDGNLIPIDFMRSSAKRHGLEVDRIYMIVNKRTKR